MTSDLQQDHDPVFYRFLVKTPFANNPAEWSRAAASISTSGGGDASDDDGANGGGDANHDACASRGDDASRDGGASALPS